MQLLYEKFMFITTPVSFQFTCYNKKINALNIADSNCRISLFVSGIFCTRWCSNLYTWFNARVVPLTSLGTVKNIRFDRSSSTEDSNSSALESLLMSIRIYPLSSRMCHLCILMV